MRATWLRSAHWPPQSPARPMSSVAPLTLRQRSRPGRPSSRRGVNDRGVGHPAALTHLPVVPRSRPRGLTPIRTPISSPCPSASTNKPAAQRVPAGIQICSAGNWGSSGRRFKSPSPRAPSPQRQVSGMQPSTVRSPTTMPHGSRQARKRARHRHALRCVRRCRRSSGRNIPRVGWGVTLEHQRPP
jgi:hypothetical protein